jgi:hypothetical protein
MVAVVGDTGDGRVKDVPEIADGVVLLDAAGVGQVIGMK